MNKKKFLSIISLMTIAILLITSSMILASSTLAKVTNLSITYENGNAKVAWSSVSEADGYDVSVNIPGYGFVNIGTVSQNRANIVGFSENSNYEIRVRAYKYEDNQKITGEYSDSKEIDTNIKANLNQVTGLTVSTNGTFATANWSSVSNATGYEIWIDIPNYGYIKIGSTTETNAFITGFQKDSNYSIKVRAYKGTNASEGYGEFSSSVSFYIEKDEIKDDEKSPEKVTNLSVSVSGNRVYLNWSKTSNTDGYIVYLKKPNSSTYIDIATTSDNSLTFDADYDTSYKVKVKAYKDVNGTTKYGDESDVQTFTTEQDSTYDKPGTVKNLSVEDIYKNTVDLDWSNVSEADGYEVWLSRENNSYESIGTIESSYATLRNLDYNTTYKAKVKAYRNVNGQKIYSQDYSSTVNFTTEEDETETKPETVRDLDVENVYKNTVDLDWSNVSGADGYEVWLSEDGGSYESQGRVTRTYVTLDDLEYNTSYKAKVKAYKNVNGQRIYSEDYSSTVSFKTEKNAKKPGKVKNLTVEDIYRNSVELDWSNVPGADGYEIWMVKGSGTYKREGRVTTSYATLRGLDYNSSYRVKVKAYKIVSGERVYSEDYSSAVNFETEESTSGSSNDDSNSGPGVIPAKVTGLKSSVSGNTAYIYWKAVPGATSYQISYDTSGYGTTVLTSEGPGRYISGLTDKKNGHKIKVRAVMNGREGSYSDSITVYPKY